MARCQRWTVKSAGRSLTLFLSQTPKQLTQPGAALAATTARRRRNQSSCTNSRDRAEMKPDSGGDLQGPP